MSGGLHSLATIIKRLEAATSRIEDFALAQSQNAPSPPKDASQYAAAPPPPPPPPPPPAAPTAQEVPPSVVAFDELVIDGKLKPFLQLTRSFAGQSVIEIVAILEKQFQGLRSFLLLSGSCQQPDKDGLEKLLVPIQADIEAITRCKDAGRKDREWFTHITIVGDGGLGVAWIVNPKPGPYLAEIKESVLYNGNKVIKEFKEKDQKHVEWVRSFIAILEAMRLYVVEHHTTGLAWNKRGITVAEYNSSRGAGGPPPPPPPPPPVTAPAASSAGGAAAVFAELNRGEEVTKGLRKVDKSEMTHKNPALRAGGSVPSSSGSAAPPKKPVKPSKPSSLSGKKPPKFALEGKNWAIEYQEHERGLTLEDVQLNQAVNLFGCKESTIVIKGKVNAVTLVNCVKTQVLVDSVVSSISVTNSPSFTLQITGSAPMIQLDTTDSGQIYLSKGSLNAEITSAKCSAINVSLPVEGEEDGVFEEQAVPEMLRTVVKNGKLVTTVVEHLRTPSRPGALRVARYYASFAPSAERSKCVMELFESVGQRTLRLPSLASMDNPGWKAGRRAQHESEYYAAGHAPVELINPMDESFIGGFHPHIRPSESFARSRPATPTTPGPPPPPKDAQYARGYQFGSVTRDSVTSSNLTAMSAVERSQFLRVPRMEPHLQFMVGPLLRYDTVVDGVWYGAVMIVTADAGSLYEPNPTLQLEWDPDQPRARPRSKTHRAHLPSFDLGPHPADPHPKNTLNGLPSGSNGHIPAPSMNARKEHVPGHEIWVYAGHNGTSTFWRFALEIPLGPNEMAITYRINNGQPITFYVPGANQNMRWAAYSCNGFSAGINPDDFRGPGYNSGYDPVWIDLLSKHAEEPFHALVGGGDQIYCDSITREPELQEWINSKPNERKQCAMTDEISSAIDRFYFNHYCAQWRSGAYARANSTIPPRPMMNMADDHGESNTLLTGLEAVRVPSSPAVFCSRRGRSRRYATGSNLPNCFINGAPLAVSYLRSQNLVVVDVDGVDDRPGQHLNRSVIIGASNGPYIPFPSHSFLGYMGPQTYILLLDCRAERKKDQVCSQAQYQKIFERLTQLPPNVEHLCVQIGIPIAYPRLVFLESALESKFNPLTALAKTGSLGLTSFVNKFNADPELLDDLNDHWTARSHKKERNWFVEQLQKFAKIHRIRISFLSGDVHCAAVGVFKTLKVAKQAEIPPPEDHRYMINVVTSAIVNTPPPNAVITMVSSLASKNHKTMHAVSTDESMIPIFATEPNGRPRKQKFIMGRRNWCQVDYENDEWVFEIRVEKEKGLGETAGYTVRTPPPRWVPTTQYH
ncbi:C-CAP/cofactor C-like domain-containing protein [Favolaschia claudopus]|uniref:Adenylyl cyclase-associated protein n=1 Tax=Favolaschia claudopus TaxID=2862362 RepID=A0AAW0ASB5_9AGAR